MFLWPIPLHFQESTQSTIHQCYTIVEVREKANEHVSIFEAAKPTLIWTKTAVTIQKSSEKTESRKAK